MNGEKDKISREMIANPSSAIMKRFKADTEAAGGRILSPKEREAACHRILQQVRTLGELWIFAYGSLIWNPTLNFIEQRKATLQGWHRAFCFKIAAGRASREKPGLMLGLVKGGHCSGVSYRIAQENIKSEVEYFCKREMLTDIYIPQFVKTESEQGEIYSLALTVDTNNPRFCDYQLDQAAKLIAQAEGQFGSNREYLFDTIDHLQQLGFHDHYLEDLATRIKALLARKPY